MVLNCKGRHCRCSKRNWAASETFGSYGPISATICLAAKLALSPKCRAVSSTVTRTSRDAATDPRERKALSQWIKPHAAQVGQDTGGVSA